MQGTQVYYNFGRTALSPGQQYTGVTASWTNSGTGNTLTVTSPAGSSTGFFPLGLTHTTQYNTPYNSQCSTPPQQAIIINKIDSQYCYYQDVMLGHGFTSAVANPQGGTGTGVWDVNGADTVLKAYNAGARSVCYLWPGFSATQTFFSVDSGGNPLTKIIGAHWTSTTSVVLSDGTGPGTGSALNNNNPPNGTIATDPSNTNQGSQVYVWGDAILLFSQNNVNDTVSSGLRSVQDYCSACTGQSYQNQTAGANAHIDVYNGQSQSCSAGAVGDYTGNGQEPDGVWYAIRLR